MKPDDLVNVFILLRPSNYMAVSMDRKSAGMMMQTWLNARVSVFGGDEKAEGWKRFLEAGTFTGGGSPEIGPGWVVAIEFITAMYVADIASGPTERLAKAQEEIAKVMKKCHDDQHRGEDWRGEDE